MKSKLNIGQIVQILANIGVIAGIIFLVIEMRQSNKQLQLQSYQSWVAASSALNIAALDPVQSEILAKGNLDPRTLTEENFISFAMWNLGSMQMAQSIDYMYRNGSLDYGLWRSEIDRATGILSMPGVRQWWEAGGKTQLTSQFVELIESTKTTSNGWDWDSTRGFVPLELRWMNLEE